MILGFSKFFKDGTPTYFREKILAGAGFGPIVSMPKIHSIRKGYRWRGGASIQMAYGRRTKQYEPFNKGIDALERCLGTQIIDIHPVKKLKRIRIWVDDKELGLEQLELLAINDGFPDVNMLYSWFPATFQGQIIHWTHYRY